MRIVRLAQLLELKYGASDNDLAWIKRQVKDGIDNYVVKPPKAYNIIPLLYQHFKDASSRQLIQLSADIYDNLDSLDAKGLFDKVNALLALIRKFQHNKGTIRQKMHDYYTRDNDREMAKSKFETVVFDKFAGVLFDAASELKNKWSFEDAIKGHPIDPQRKELSKQDIWMWVHGHPAAQKYGLDNMEVFSKVYEDLELRHDLTTIVYATKRARKPYSTQQVEDAVKEIMDIFRSKQTNEPYFEAGEGVAKEMARPKYILPSQKEPVSEINQKDFMGPEPGYDPGFVAERDKQEQERLRLHERNRLEEEERKQQEEDRERHVRSEGAALLKALIKKRYL